MATIYKPSLLYFTPVFGGLTAQVDWLCLRVGGHPALSLHSSNEPGELGHDDSTINIVVVIIFTISITFVQVVLGGGVEQQDLVREPQLVASFLLVPGRRLLRLGAVLLLGRLFLELTEALELRRATLLGQLQSVGDRHLVDGRNLGHEFRVIGHGSSSSSSSSNN